MEAPTREGPFWHVLAGRRPPPPAAATLGPALVATLPPGQFAPTLDLHVQFLRPARPGRLVGRGRVVRRGRQVCFMSGELLGPDGESVAVATATAHLQTLDRA
ncbi:hypothetical protein HCN51_12430 [Nonomuraea sp. FMUSA5-5]|uniref:Thioesterase domain-containing protein n=1 Tax=Nonomuraea composti TaxID=2720023 RepID=A0ABX1B109_9ACTN|nr:hotdog domain-containing protein [Nonomuraea sp. FMUSA5-5]NJP90245.1 hypothetical protein [Nonomuraea sp. FMUSA5-5]